MPAFYGARDLGLKTEWRFGFIGYGVRAETTPGVIFVDGSGSIKPGVIDHHSGDCDEESSAEAVFRRRDLIYNHLLADWLRRYEIGGIQPGTIWKPALVTHAYPDWDSVVECFLIQYLVEHGDFPPYAGALVTYSRDVDQGRYSVRLDDPQSIYAPHIAYLALQNMTGNDEEALSSDSQLKRGLELLERILNAIQGKRQATGM